MTVGRIPNIEGGIQPTLLTTTGDIMYASSANNPARLGIGSSAQVLTVASGVPSWATPTSGGMTLLSTTTLSGASTVISSISQDYNKLVAIIYNVYLNTPSFMRINPNSNSGYARSLYYTSGTLTPSTNTNISSRALTNVSGDATEVTFYFELNNYASTTSRKPFIFYGNADSGDQESVQHGLWNRTAAVTSLQFTTSDATPTYTAGTVLLYGVK